MIPTTLQKNSISNQVSDLELGNQQIKQFIDNKEASEDEEKNSI